MQFFSKFGGMEEDGVLLEKKYLEKTLKMVEHQQQIIAFFKVMHVRVCTLTRRKASAEG